MREALIDDIDQIVKRYNLAVEESRDHLFEITLRVNANNCQLSTAYKALDEARAAMRVADRILADHPRSSAEVNAACFVPTNSAAFYGTEEPSYAPADILGIG